MASGLAQVGDEWEGYTVVEAIGQRGMAERYRARSADGGFVLLDVLAVHHPELQARLTAARLQDLSHPSLLRVHEVIHVLRFPALVMDDTTGVDLLDWLETAPPLEDRLMVFRSLVEGLQVLHAHDLVHADLQPGSVLVEDDGAAPRARLALPGVASVVFSLIKDGASVSTSGSALGRADYLAPERARTPELADKRSDMYSLGCLLYLVVSGQSPFQGLDRFACFKATKAEDYLPLDQRVPAAPADVVAICHRLLRAHPDDRFQHSGEVIDRLEASGVSSPPTERPRPVRTFQPVAFVLGGAGLAVVLAFVAWWAVG